MSTEATLSFPSLLEEHNVTIKKPMMGRQAVQRQPSIGDYQRIVSPESISLPDDFLHFLVQVGPGTLGNVRIFGVTQPISQFDFRFHSHRLNQKRQSSLNELLKESSLASSFESQVRSLVFFAQDTNQEDLWYAYKQPKNSEDEASVNYDDIFVIDTDEEAAMLPPQRICKKGFEQFVREVCLGNRLADKDIVSTKVLREQSERDYESDEEDPERVFSFLPFSQP